MPATECRSRGPGVWEMFLREGTQSWFFGIQLGGQVVGKVLFAFVLNGTLTV